MHEEKAACGDLAGSLAAWRDAECRILGVVELVLKVCLGIGYSKVTLGLSLAIGSAWSQGRRLSSSWPDAQFWQMYRASINRLSVKKTHLSMASTNRLRLEQTEEISPFWLLGPLGQISPGML